jgi:hypothetical protein
MMLIDNINTHNLYLYQTDMYSSIGSLVTATKPKNKEHFHKIIMFTSRLRIICIFYTEYVK